jgi:hypothetical protein
MKILFRLFLLALAVAALASCNSKNELMPLNKGNLWIYYAERFDSLGNVYFSTYYYETIIGDSTIGNDKAFVKRNASMRSRSELLLNTKDGLSVLQKDSSKGIAFKYPLNVGETYINKDFDTVKLTASDKEITTKAGSFKCLEYEVKSSVFRQLYYVCPGVGIIRKDEYLLVDGADMPLMRSQLTKYVIN